LRAICHLNGYAVAASRRQQTQRRRGSIASAPCWDFSTRPGFGAAARARIAGDASTRSYERLVNGGNSVISG